MWGSGGCMEGCPELVHLGQGNGTHFLKTHLIFPTPCLTSHVDLSGINNLRRPK